MRNFQDTFETNKRSFISAFSICMTVPLRLVQCENDTLTKFRNAPFPSPCFY